MSDAMLHEVAFVRYHRWLARAAGNPVPLVVCNAAGELVWCDESEAATALVQAMIDLRHTGFDWAFAGGGFASHLVFTAHAPAYRACSNGRQTLYCHQFSHIAGAYSISNNNRPQRYTKYQSRSTHSSYGGIAAAPCATGRSIGKGGGCAHAHQ